MGTMEAAEKRRQILSPRTESHQAPAMNQEICSAFALNLNIYLHLFY